MICTYLDNKFDWLDLAYGLVHPINCGLWLSEVWQNRETNQEHDEDCVEEGCQLARVKIVELGKIV